jgi:DNA-binding transcriptional ArsR family regulator
MSHIDNKVFKAVSSTTRLDILKTLSEREMHITGLAEALGISVPVAAKHVKILEEAGLIERRTFGRTHLLKSTIKNLHEILNCLADTTEIEVEKNTNVLDVLKKVCAVEVTKIGGRELVVSIDGKKGLYIYEIDGKPSDKAVEEALLEKDTTLEWRELIPVTQKRIHIKIKKNQ